MAISRLVRILSFARMTMRPGHTVPPERRISAFPSLFLRASCPCGQFFLQAPPPFLHEIKSPLRTYHSVRRIRMPARSQFAQLATKFGVLVGAILVVTVLRSEEHTSELQSHSDLVCRLLL